MKGSIDVFVHGCSYDIESIFISFHGRYSGIWHIHKGNEQGSIPCY